MPGFGRPLDHAILKAAAAAVAGERDFRLVRAELLAPRLDQLADLGVGIFSFLRNDGQLRPGASAQISTIRSFGLQRPQQPNLGGDVLNVVVPIHARLIWQPSVYSSVFPLGSANTISRVALRRLGPWRRAAR